MTRLITTPDDPARPHLSYQIEQMRDQLATMQFKFGQNTLAFSALALAVCTLDLAKAVVFNESEGYSSQIKALLGQVSFSLVWFKGAISREKETNQ